MAKDFIDELVTAFTTDGEKAEVLIGAIANAPVAKFLALLKRPEESVRRLVVLAARRRTEPDLLAAVSERRFDGSSLVRAAVAELAATTPALLGDDAIGTLLEDEAEIVRGPAATAARGRPAIELALVPLLGDTAWKVRQMAADALVDARSPEVFTKLLERVGEDDDTDVRRASAASALKLLGRAWEKPLAWPALATLRKTKTNLDALGVGFASLQKWVDELLAREVDSAALRDHGVLLSDDVASGKLPRAFGVDTVCDAVLRVLMGDGPRAAVLVGDPGVGKTAVVHEITRRLATHPDGPWVVVQIAPGEFVAGTKYTGEWETKLTKIVDLMRAPKRVLLYVPNLEQLSQVGTWSKSDVNVASMLTPHLERGTIALLGESTTESFRTGLGAVPAIRRVFSVFDIGAASAEQTRSILEAIGDEAGQPAPEDVYDRLAELSAFYLTGASEPGRSAGILRRVLSTDAVREGPWGERDVLEVLSATTGIPAAILDDSVPLDRQAARAFLEERVMGQREAVDALVDLITLVKAGLTDPDKPLGVMLFVGPTGVGKTELARSLAELLFGDPARLVRFDMSEFATYEAFERLIGKTGGAPGLLTEAAHEQPFCVLLLDEIEKAHLNVFDLCLQIFDAGRLTDVRGRTADFRRTIIILTSNVGSRVEREGPVGFGRGGPKLPDRDSTTRELGRVFRPEFLNRLDRIVTFRPLDEETAARIARRELGRVLVRSGIRRRKLTIDVGDDVLSLLLREGYSIAFGARPLKRTVERLVLLPLARAIASGDAVAGSILRLRTRGNRLEVEVATPRDAEGARVSSPTGRPTPIEAEGATRSDAVDARIESLRALARPMEEQKAALLDRAAQRDFWTEKDEARAVLDDVYRIDGVLRALDLLEEAARAGHGGAKATAELERRTEHLELLLRSPSTARLADAYVDLRLVSSQGEGLGAVESLARMYMAFAARHGFEVAVVDDRVSGDPAEDTALLLITGPGANALLASEAGLHEVARGAKPLRRGADARGRRTKEDEEVRPTDRDVVRVEVVPAPTDLQPFTREEEVRVFVRPLPRPHKRLSHPRWEITLLHPPTMIGLQAWSETRAEQAIERLSSLLRARVNQSAAAGAVEEAGRSRPAPGALAVVRRYVLGPTPFVRDLRTGKKTGKIERVLDGRIEMFLRPPADDDPAP